MSNPGSSSELDSLCIRVGRLRITVEQVREGPAPSAGSEASFEVVDPEEIEEPLAGEGSSTPAEVGLLQLGDLEHLALNLSDSGLWTGKARVARAYRAGLSAAEVLRGDRGAPVTSPKLELKNRYYICLRSQAYPAGFVTQHYEGLPQGQSGSLGKRLYQPRLCKQV